MKENYDRRFCVAPMMGYTTPYARKLYRILSKKSFLFTEMIACKSLIYSKKKDLIIENDNHNPVALQVGGSDIEDLKKCSQIARDYNYDEINLNVGCPSKAVQKGAFGACLMKNKKLVRDCLDVMQNGKNSEWRCMPRNQGPLGQSRITIHLDCPNFHRDALYLNFTLHASRFYGLHLGWRQPKLQQSFVRKKVANYWMV